MTDPLNAPADPTPAAKVRALARGTRPWTDPINHHPGAGSVLTLKRACNGCGDLLGDATDLEIAAAIAGDPLPDTTIECGCTPVDVCSRCLALLTDPDDPTCLHAHRLTMTTRAYRAFVHDDPDAGIQRIHTTIE